MVQSVGQQSHLLKSGDKSIRKIRSMIGSIYGRMNMNAGGVRGDARVWGLDTIQRLIQEG